MALLNKVDNRWIKLSTEAVRHCSLSSWSLTGIVSYLRWRAFVYARVIGRTKKGRQKSTIEGGKKITYGGTIPLK